MVGVLPFPSISFKQATSVMKAINMFGELLFILEC